MKSLCYKKHNKYYCSAIQDTNRRRYACCSFFIDNDNTNQRPCIYESADFSCNNKKATLVAEMLHQKYNDLMKEDPWKY